MSFPFYISIQSALDPAREQASRISGRWLFYFAVLIGVFTLVIAALMAAIALRRHEAEVDETVRTDPRRQRRLGVAVTSALVVTTGILLMLLFVDFPTDRAMAAPAPDDALVIRIIGQQWWWQ